MCSGYPKLMMLIGAPTPLPACARMLTTSPSSAPLVLSWASTHLDTVLGLLQSTAFRLPPPSTSLPSSTSLPLSTHAATLPARVRGAFFTSSPLSYWSASVLP